jgi:hypothetical protein
MPPMEGNFNDKLEILWEGKGVAARGPVEWSDDATGVSATLHVVIMQGTVAATGRTGDDLSQSADEFLVAAGVQGNGTLTDGPAVATGLALIHGNEVEMYQWSKGVVLESGTPAAGITEDLSPAKKSRVHA